MRCLIRAATSSCISIYYVVLLALHLCIKTWNAYTAPVLSMEILRLGIPAELIWCFLFFNETGAALLQTCAVIRRTFESICVKQETCLKVRAGRRLRSPIVYPPLRAQMICLQFPNLTVREPAQLYECLSGLRSIPTVMSLRLHFQLLRKSTLECLRSLLEELLDSVCITATCSLQLRCEFPLGIRHSSTNTPASVENSGVYMLMHQLLHYFSVDLQCAYMQHLITPDDVVCWLESQ